MAKYGGDEKNKFNEKVLDKTSVLELVIDKLTGKQSGLWE
jgi:hypothetical protein